MNGASLQLHLWLIPLIPFVGFLLNGLLGRKLPRAVVSTVALVATAIPFALAVNAWTHFDSLSLPYVEKLSIPWIATTTFHASFALSLDQLTMIMVLIVTGVGFLIHLYSVGYMAHEDGFYRFFAYLNLFMFFMLTLVLSENFLLLFVGWEGVGLASYLLIGFYYQKHSAANAGKKAFIVNRIGDFGFLLAMFLMIQHFGTLSFREIFAQISAHPEWHGGFLTAIALLLVVGATGKSAQIPLYVWLPDAMEGPTPVSALIHAATMVTAGIYLVVRSHVLFDRAPIALAVVAIIGAATAFFAATIGIVQTDIKRVLAYSTISQLGYMFMACGAAAYSAAIFHLLTHAFFKALLFLAAGSVIHAVGGEQDMRLMGGLRKYTPITCWTMFVGVLAISGIPPFAGFFSKDEILAEVFRSPSLGPVLGHALWFVGFVTAFMTAFYMFRLWYMTFSRTYRGEERTAAHGHTATHDAHGHASHPHESPWLMLTPLVLLAILSFIGGWVGVPEVLHGHDEIGHFLSPVVHGQAMSFEQATVANTIPSAAAPVAPETAAASPADATTELTLSGLSVFAGFLGWFLADLLYRRKPELPAKIGAKIRGVLWLVENKYWVDELYAGLIVKPVLMISRYALWIVFDRGLVDGAGAGIGAADIGLGSIVRRMQSGNIRSYAGWLAFGAAALLLITYFSLGSTHLGIH
jgi:NADH-quinone oxidoreductase subunit L